MTRLLHTNRHYQILEKISDSINDNFLKEESDKLLREQAIIDSTYFINFLLPINLILPIVSFSNDGEILITYRNFKDRINIYHEALISFEGDKHFGYCYLENNIFVPGNYDGNLDIEILPEDLYNYLIDNFID